MSRERAKTTIESLPELRRQFESSQALMARARERAIRVAEEAVAMRTLLQARTGASAAPGADSPSRDVWTAAARAIADASRDRDRELAALSHELRQALGAALAAERLLIESPGTTASSRAASVLDRQLRHLARLVDLMLDYSRLSVGRVALASEPVDIRDLLRENAEAIESAAADRNLRLTVTPSPDAQVVEGDPTRLRQLLSNLLQNALRYTPAGGRIACATATIDREAHVMVRDTGIGLAAGDRERIFEPFTRVTEQGEGLGIGLALARRIARVHGGDLHVESDGPGCGSTFTVVLPLATRG